MFYTYRNIPITLNKNELLVNSAQISTAANLLPNYTEGNRYSFEYSPGDGINGNLRLSYFLTGKDFLRDCITNQIKSISGNISELYFNKGYLNNYSINAEPNSPVSVQANIVFFEPMTGQFVAKTPVKQSSESLNFGDAVIYDLTNYSIEPITNILSYSYNYFADVRPVYYTVTGTGLSNISPDRIAWGVKEINTDIVTDSLSGKLSIKGEKAGFKISFTHPKYPSLNESITSSGFLYQRVIDSSIDQITKTTLSIKQNNIEEPPIITSLEVKAFETIGGFSGISGWSGYAGQDVAIYGSNLLNTTDVLFGDEPSKFFTVESDSVVTAKIPINGYSSKITLKSFAGTAQTTTSFKYNHPAITINSIDPNSITSGVIQISGSNFYRISEVRFDNNTGVKFNVVNSNIIQAYVPENANLGYISVVSSLRELTGISSTKFTPTPFISGFVPGTGISGTIVNIYGNNFSGVTGIYFNNISVTGFNVLSKTGLRTYVPTGNINGFISISGQNDTYVTSTSKFLSEIKITGILPSSGNWNDFVAIYGNNIESEYLYKQNDGNYRVLFGGGIITGFAISGGFNGGLFSGANALTGLVPTGTISGLVYILRPDGGTYGSGTRFRKLRDIPVVNNFNPTFALSGTNIGLTINGEGIYEVSRVIFTGVDLSVNYTSGFTVPTGKGTTKYIWEDVMGKRLNISNFPLTGIPLSYYNLAIVNSAGTGWAKIYDTFQVVSGYPSWF